MEELVLRFSDGTLMVEAPRETELPLQQWCIYDMRYNVWRCHANEYHRLVEYLYTYKIPYRDEARRYNQLSLMFQECRQPRDYQLEAVENWKQARKRGIIVLPTGTGKTFVALMCIQAAARTTLVVVPTIDLMEQWASQVEQAFGIQAGRYGGGFKELQEVTIATYDSAQLFMESYGNRFGLLVVDECHHLPGIGYRQLALECLAPFRLGVSATPERTDGGETVLDELLGGICYRKDIDEMPSEVLSNYETRRIFVELNAEERTRYQQARQVYTGFLRRWQIDVSGTDGWQNFVKFSVIKPGGREALRAYLEQKQIAISSSGKLDALWSLLQEHRSGRIIVFTSDNKTAYSIGERFFLPVLTHHTKAQERKEFLESFRRGEYPCIVTSKVLNEGVDVPEADVGIVVSGSGSVREHVQRLGRILRPTPGKQAILYELISEGTSEWNVSDRRRQHRAYERFNRLPH